MCDIICWSLCLTGRNIGWSLSSPDVMPVDSSTKTPLDIAAVERRRSSLRSIQIESLMASVLWTATIV